MLTGLRSVFERATTPNDLLVELKTNRDAALIKAGAYAWEMFGKAKASNKSSTPFVELGRSLGLDFVQYVPQSKTVVAKLLFTRVDVSKVVENLTKLMHEH